MAFSKLRNDRKGSDYLIAVLNNQLNVPCCRVSSGPARLASHVSDPSTHINRVNRPATLLSYCHARTTTLSDAKRFINGSQCTCSASIKDAMTAGSCGIIRSMSQNVLDTIAKSWICPIAQAAG